jgi:hypothetical protein
MFAMMAWTQWRWTRTVVYGIAALAFVFPTLTRFLARNFGSDENLAQVLDGFAVLGPMLGFLSLLGPFALAALPWTIDNETRHVYPLSLPVPWQWWVGTRFAVGALSLIIPAVALWAGAVATVSVIELPPLLHAYPGALALRFLLACLVSYSLSFALQYLAGRRATQVAVGFLVSVLLVVIAATMLGQEPLLERIARYVFVWPGPLAIFVEPWTLIDV